MFNVKQTVLPKNTIQRYVVNKLQFLNAKSYRCFTSQWPKLPQVNRAPCSTDLTKTNQYSPTISRHTNRKTQSHCPPAANAFRLHTATACSVPCFVNRLHQHTHTHTHNQILIFVSENPLLAVPFVAYCTQYETLPPVNHPSPTPKSPNVRIRKMTTFGKVFLCAHSIHTIRVHHSASKMLR